MKIDNIRVTQPRRTEGIKNNVERGNIENQLLKDSNKQFPQRNESHESGRGELEKAVDLINEALKMADKKFDFELHEGTNRTMVKVVDRETEEIIREIPP